MDEEVEAITAWKASNAERIAGIIENEKTVVAEMEAKGKAELDDLVH